MFTKLEAMTTAEQAYIFRHNLVRQGAYDLMPPSHRSELHEHALDIFESLPVSDQATIANELADHAQNAWQFAEDTRRREQLQKREARWLQLAAETARNNSNMTRAYQLWTRLAVNTTATDEQRHNALLQGAEMGLLVGRRTEADEMVTKAEALAEKSGDSTWTGLTLLTRRRLSYATRANIDDGLKLVHRALELFQHAGDDLNAAKAMGELGNVLGILGRNEEALEMFTKSEALFRKLNHGKGCTTSAGNIAICLRRFGRSSEAETMLRQSIEQDTQDGRWDDVARHLANLALVLIDQQHYEEALKSTIKAEGLFRQQGDNLSLSRTLVAQADIRLRLGQHNEACDVSEQAEKLARESGNASVPAQAALIRGQALLKAGNQTEAAHYLNQAAKQFTTLKDQAKAEQAQALLKASSTDQSTR
jgi:tetratricopeptide (TPR) repeat protein